MLNKLVRILTKADKSFILILIVFSLVISLIETFAVSIIMPFISIANDFTLIESNRYFNYIYTFFSFESKLDFIIFFGLSLILFYIVRSFINIFYVHLLAKFSYGRYHSIAYKLFNNYLGLRYDDFICKNTSTLTKSIVSEAKNLTELISAYLFMFSEIFVTIFIYIIMLWINWKLTIVFTFLIVIKVLIIFFTVSKEIKKSGKKKEKLQKKFFKIINSTFGNFKLIKLLSNEKEVLNDFSKASEGYANIHIRSQTLSQMPRLILESVGFILLIGIVLYLLHKYQHDISSNMGLIAMFILALYRLLPSINRIINSYNKVMFYHKSLDLIHDDINYDIETLGEQRVIFNNKIELKNIKLKFENNYILDGIDLLINKNEKIAIVGETGSGKSSLIDLIAGLYKSCEGTIYIDEKSISNKNIVSWRKKIGYIPQHVYLFDGSVAENICFGFKRDNLRIKKVLEQVSLLNFLENSRDGIDSDVGENGLKLSGGQKQRIGIARALYSDPEVLIMDESTSSLDMDIEKEIMDKIYDISTNKTLIIIAHRLSSIERCDKRYKVENKKLVEISRGDF